MASHKDVAKAFKTGNKLTGKNMFTDGKIIYSWGYHFPIAKYLNDGRILFNTDKYSCSTSKHQNHVKQLWDESSIINCITQEIKKAIDFPDEPIIITIQERPDRLNIIMECLRDYCKGKGVKRFPMQKISDSIEEMIVLDNI